MTHNRPGTGVDEDDPERSALQRRLLLVPFCVAVFSLSALFYYHLRQDVIAVQSPLQIAYSAIYDTFGFAPSLMFFLLLLIWTSIWFFTGRIERPWTRLLRLAATTVMLGIFLNVGETATALPQQGELGAFFATRMVAAFGYYPTLILVLVATLGALLLATDFLFSETFERLWARSTARDEPSDPAEDFGVEVAVTDHLKGLAAAAPPAPQPKAARPAPAPPVDRDRDNDAVVAEAREFAEPEPEIEPEIDDPVPDVQPAPERRSRRRSYFERRHAGSSEFAGDEIVIPDDPVPEGWVPRAPEAQEIDNPESAALESAALEAAAAELAEAVGASPVPGPEGAGAESDGAPASVVPEEEIPEEEIPAEDLPAEDVPDEGVAAGAARPEEVWAEDDSEDDDSEDDDSEDDAAEELPTDPDEPLFAIPRPEPAAPATPPPSESEPDPEAHPEEEPANSGNASRQQRLFGSDLDEDLIDEAKQVVLETRRASAAFLRRRLRVGYDEAVELLAELSARGVVELGEDSSQGRVL